MKNHLKRIATPRTWSLARKKETFIVRPHAGGHSLEFGMSLGMVLRDKLGLVQTLREGQKMLHNQKVLVDGKQRKDRRDMVGLFDVISFPALKKQYHITLNQKGKLVVEEVSETQSNSKKAKVTGKSVVPGGKTQLHLHDGKNVLYDGAVKVGDSVELSLPDYKVKSVLSRQNGAEVFLTQGKHAGSTGSLTSFEGDLASYLPHGSKDKVETATKYLFVVGKGKVKSK